MRRIETTSYKPMTRTQEKKITQRALYDVDLPETIDWDKIYSTRLPTSTRSYQPLVTKNPVNLVIHTQRKKPVKPAPKGKDSRAHWLVSLGGGMLAVLTLWGGIGVIGNWWQGVQDDLHYGRPRTFQIDAVVGHHDSYAHPSHFTVENMKGHVVIIEFPGGDLTHTTVYSGPVLSEENTPITLTFEDVRQNGKPQMVIHIENQDTILLNDGTQFQTS